ncbi:deoxyuridine 5'-triphosphate nucleotidohydrolase [Boeremia exigua]|uniref:deoxyuridine 5'-triphosphate nucleotidohydrolase n=1 Tax=Boeremia exigua TaxID=749465 RepID=UPI001E8EDD75|nr:deoxyuridine 5'-triphosphate nucleotidohydrolase [Boeremia exigua]KAH6638877.1 deoxyuridine 5'-triphosphate nucleotidohydrolase [Boeremia exigua]
MIIPGRVAHARNVVKKLLSVEKQAQPCGVDLTLKRIKTWSSAGAIDFDNTHRKTAGTVDMPFRRLSGEPHIPTSRTSKLDEQETEAVETDYVDVACGSYLVEFNELVDMPLDLMGQIMVRSSLFRSGALVHAGVMDSGYKGAVGGVLQVVNPYGLRLYKDAKLAQIVFHEMSEPVEGYSGIYQGRTHI